MNNSHRTAISRRALSAPMTKLFVTGLLQGPILDYGCGRGDDADRLSSVHGVTIEKYDPHYFPCYPDGWFKTTTCLYVLNVIPDQDERRRVVSDILHHTLLAGGNAYFAIRRGRDLKGWTSKGTWQGYVGDELPTYDLSLLHRQSDYEIWWGKSAIPDGYIPVGKNTTLCIRSI